jgi:acetyl esterase/lipase
MKVLKFIFVIIIITAIFSQHLAAQDSVLQSGGLLKAWREKRQATKELETVSANVITKLDVPYLNDNDPLHKLDIYSPSKKDKPLAVLVHIHGGGWEIGDKKMMKNTGMFYASKGILFITPNYRLSPKVKHPAHVEDCAAALAWVFDHASELGGDKSRIFLSGHSAGAHLAALLGTKRTYLQKYNIKPNNLAGVIPVDTASFDLVADGNERLVKKFVKDAFGEDQEVLKSASPFYNVSDMESYPKFLIFNTTNRESAAKGGNAFADKLKSVGCDVRFVPVDNHTHGEMAAGMYDASDPVGSAILKFILL